MTLGDVRALAATLVALALVAGAGVPSGATAPVEIDACTTIDEPGTYVLTTDVEDGGKTAISKACIEITADGVTFDGGDHLLDGRGVSHTKGVAVVGAADVTIRNLAVDDWHYGVLVADGSARVHDVRTFSNAYGIRLENAAGTAVANNTVEDNLVGIWTDSEAVTLVNNDLSGNEIPIKQLPNDSEMPPARVGLATAVS